MFKGIISLQEELFSDFTANSFVYLDVLSFQDEGRLQGASG